MPHKLKVLSEIPKTAIVEVKQTFSLGGEVRRAAYEDAHNKLQPE